MSHYCELRVQNLTTNTFFAGRRSCKPRDRKTLPLTKFYKKVSEPVKLCGVMTLSLGSYPEWITVACNESLMVDILCFNKSSSGTKPKKQLVSEVQCSADHILFRGECYLLNRNKNRNSTLLTSGQFVKTVHYGHSVQHIFHDFHIILHNLFKISFHYLAFWFPPSEDYNHCSTFQKIKNKQEYIWRRGKWFLLTGKRKTKMEKMQCSK